MTAFQPMNLGFMELAFYMLLGTVILIDLIVIGMVQLGYQIKVGNTQIIGGTGTRRVVATIFGYEIAIGGYSRDRNWKEK